MPGPSYSLHSLFTPLDDVHVRALLKWPFIGRQKRNEEVMKVLGISREVIRDMLLLKHGLERS